MQRRAILVLCEPTVCDYLQHPAIQGKTVFLNYESPALTVELQERAHGGRGVCTRRTARQPVFCAAQDHETRRGGHS